VLGKDVTTDCPERQSHNHRTKEQRTLTTDCTDFTDEKLKILFEMKDFFLQWYSGTDSTDKEVLWQAPFGQEKHTCRVGEREPRIDTNGRECFGR